mgnify:CR=1 FL=1
MTHVLPDLPYAYNALEPYIDEQTMHIHHDKHHAAYVNNLNAILAQHPQLQTWTAQELLVRLADVPESVRTTVQNNAGGHVNHTLFWEIMGPNSSGEPSSISSWRASSDRLVRSENGIECFTSRIPSSSALKMSKM